jgi:predicted acyl esterase
MAHETYDEYWKSHSIYQHLRNIKPAILTVGGWCDVEDLHGTLGTYRTVEKEYPGLQNTLVMGPWAHGRWSSLTIGNENRGVSSFDGTRAYFQTKVELPFFNCYLKWRGPEPARGRRS